MLAFLRPASHGHRVTAGRSRAKKLLDAGRRRKRTLWVSSTAYSPGTNSSLGQPFRDQRIGALIFLPDAQLNGPTQLFSQAPFLEGRADHQRLAFAGKSLGATMNVRSGPMEFSNVVCERGARRQRRARQIAASHWSSTLARAQCGLAIRQRGSASPGRPTAVTCRRQEAVPARCRAANSAVCVSPSTSSRRSIAAAAAPAPAIEAVFSNSRRDTLHASSGKMSPSRADGFPVARSEKLEPHL